MSELQEARWYVAHTYSGHENKVKATIEKAVKTRGMEDYIKEVVVPTEDVVETTKTGKEKTRQRKIFPGYVLVKMIITDESWYIVRNTKGVTGFVGPGSKPVPLSKEEVITMGLELTEPKIGTSSTDLEIGDTVKVSNGSFAGQIGSVEDINLETKQVKLRMDSFGNATLLLVELDGIEQL